MPQAPAIIDALLARLGLRAPKPVDLSQHERLRRNLETAIKAAKLARDRRGAGSGNVIEDLSRGTYKEGGR